MQNEENELNEAELEKVLAGLPLEAINDLQPEMVAENTRDVQAQQTEELEVAKEDKEQKEGFFKKLFNRIKAAFQKDVKQLPEGKPSYDDRMENVTTTSAREEFLKGIAVSNDELGLDELDEVKAGMPTIEKEVEDEGR